MGLGTGLSVAGMALGTQLARNWFEAFVKPYSSQPLFRINTGVWLRMIGGLIILFLGLSLLPKSVRVSLYYSMASYPKIDDFSSRLIVNAHQLAMDESQFY